MLSMEKFKNGFTLSEFLIVIGVIGAIAVITFPIMRSAFPSKEEELQKKMTYLVEQISTQMYENEAYYPRTSDIAKFGFFNTDEVTVDGIKFGGTTDDERASKFCKLFAHQFTNVNPSSVTCVDNVETDDPSFRSSDGVDWWIPKTTFLESTNGQTKGFAKIKIDVNGKDKAPNCAKGTQGCKKPDIYYYHIKTNGSVTLANPTAISEKTYQVITEITTKDLNGNTLSTQGGTLEIAPINADGTYGTFSSDSNKFDNLEANSSYMLRAIPNEGYVSNWGTKNTNVASERRYGYKKIRTTKTKTELKLEFSQIKTYCIKLKVDCTSPDINSCISEKSYSYGCKFIESNTIADESGYNTGGGDYRRTSEFLDNYDYVGPFKGNYSYVCDSNDGALNFGTGADAGYLTACGLESGDYKLYVKPATGMKIYPYIDENVYKQNVRLGTSDLSDFEVEIRNY